MDKDTVVTLAAGGLITAVFTYITNIFVKRSDKMDEVEKRLGALEVVTADIKYLKEKQSSLDHKVDTILELLTELRIQINSTNRRPKVKEVNNA